MSLTGDVRANGVVRAFEPRVAPDGWHCRGRVMLDEPSRRGALTRQCGRRLDQSWRWCPSCGGLLAWGGVVWYGGVPLRHLERTGSSG